MKITKDNFEILLSEISEHNGRSYGRAFAIFDAQDSHGLKCSSEFKGFFALSDAFKCFFLESIELLNILYLSKPKAPISSNYILFLPRIIISFRSLCGAEHIAVKGYPLDSLTLLRNIFDNLILTSAALQKIISFEEIDALNEEDQRDQKRIKNKRITVERRVRKIMTGNESGLTESTLIELSKLNDFFDLEVHGSRLSLNFAHPWMTGESPLPFIPKYSETAFAMFMNRFWEVAWMLHRLTPYLQPINSLFGNKWGHKWEVLDSSFGKFSEALTAQAKKKIGIALVEFVNTKFPFKNSSFFPL